MDRKQLRNMLQLMNILLCVSVVVMLAIAIELFLLHKQQQRYVLHVEGPTRELYILDTVKGNLYITSSEMVKEYGREMWTRFAPAQHGNSLLLREALHDKAGSQIRKRFIDEVQQIQREQSQESSQGQ